MEDQAENEWNQGMGKYDFRIGLLVVCRQWRTHAV